MEVFISSHSLKFSKVEFADGASVRDVLLRYTEGQGLSSEDFYVLRDGRVSDLQDRLQHGSVYRLEPRLRGGKGGFGSMLRALGAQIEKTTNREACRDLSGRRLRDVNHEKEMAEWLKKQAEREAEKEQRRLERLQRKLAEPKHQFTDPEYQQQCHDLSERLEDSVLKGLQVSCSSQVKVDDVSAVKRRSSDDSEQPEQKKKKQKKTAAAACFWTGVGDLPSSEEEDEEEEDEDESPSTSSSCGAAAAVAMTTQRKDDDSPSSSSSCGAAVAMTTETKDDNSPSSSSSCGAAVAMTTQMEAEDSPSSSCSTSSQTVTRTSETSCSQQPQRVPAAAVQPPAAVDVSPVAVDVSPAAVVDPSSVADPSPAVDVSSAAVVDPSSVADPSPAVDVSSAASPQQLESLGLDVLKEELMSRGLKCGGTLAERAARLFSVRGLTAAQINPALLAKPAKTKKK
ncbi:splicing regulator SDE2 [Scomber japonicus]|uniref:splicing regulator SDE2 n=1 Tax=Scomber japonicus TaxID=13676 RepID=UPI0023051C91|nr:splicing regulator SDE2 [Scomber japonicus]